MLKKLLAIYSLVICTTSHAQANTEMLPAAINTLEVMHKLTLQIQSCKSSFNSHVIYFDFFQNLWNIENHMEVSAATRILNDATGTQKKTAKLQEAKLKSEFLSSYNQKSDDQKGDYCQSILTEMQNNRMDIEKIFPNESKNLQKAFIDQGNNKNFRRDNDLTIGCIKGLYNKGVIDAKVTTQVCTCATNAILAKGTSEEVDEWVATEDKSTILKKPWAQGLVTELQNCSAGN